MERWNWARASLVAALAGVSLLSACTVGPSAGIGGAAVTVLLLLLLAGGTASTQSGCSSDTQGDDWDFSDATHEDTDERDSRVGPCLSVIPDSTTNPPPDTGEDADTTITPCLGRPLDTGVDPDPDTGPDAGDTGPRDADDASDALEDTELGANEHDDRSEVIAKLRDRLPDDVADRLEDDENA